ncbi:extended synaptotagmin-3-like protein [Lates japonicus]|uniref:Extended synaptotagmin-3-like protein n=1 Tax=Lates japonicus TaxID=270547 RepID=A0AAD3MUM6_LATJO|nr:extended synaptotagmin-3-like protein [Lates japonicus]
MSSFLASKPAAVHLLPQQTDSGTDSTIPSVLLDQTWNPTRQDTCQKRTINPVFNDNFEFDVSLQEAQTRKLDVAVKNNKMFHTGERTLAW